jgi:hypothetical protein
MAVVVVLAFGAAACGSDGLDDLGTGDGSTGDGSSDTTFNVGSLLDDLGSGGGSDGPTFEQVDGLEVRFANVYSDDDGGHAVDVYWGGSPEDGVLALTLEYGEVSDYIPAQIQTDTMIEQTSPTMTFTVAGKTDEDSVLMAGIQGTPTGTTQQTFVLGSDRDAGGTVNALFGSIVEEGEDYPLSSPPSGKGYLYLVTTGIDALDDLDGGFVELGSHDTCLTTEMADGNAGGAMAVDPGTVNVEAYDVNHQCTPEWQATDPIDVSIGDGDRVLLFIYGPNPDDRQLTVAPVG